MIHSEKSSKFSASQIQTKEAFFQAKLNVGMPDDPYEQEAEKVSQQLVQNFSTLVEGQGNKLNNETTGQPIQPSFFPGQISRRVQAKCAECEKEEKQVHTKSVESNSTHTVSPITERQIMSSKGNGQSLDAGTKAIMEHSIGADFSSVRIHTNSQAVQMSKDLGAHAFTLGNDIYFNEGGYKPETKAGIGLLSHELTHVVQQGGAVQTKRKSYLPGNDIFTNPALLMSGSNSLQQSSIFRKAINSFQQEMSQFGLMQQQQMLQPSLKDKVQLKDNSKTLRRCAQGCSGSGCGTTAAPAACTASATGVSLGASNAFNDGTSHGLITPITVRGTDLADVQDSEQVSASVDHTGSFSGMASVVSNTSGFMAADNIPPDRHLDGNSHTLNRFDNNGGDGTWAFLQLDIIKIPSCGISTAVAMPNSGYRIKREVKAVGTSVKGIVTKTAEAVSVNGFTASAGLTVSKKAEVVLRP
ncbi:hypothetical protein BH11BAC3_BH11BAC3_18190 [soil metagenome]